jgi:hypothetical protein
MFSAIDFATHHKIPFVIFNNQPEVGYLRMFANLVNSDSRCVTFQSIQQTIWARVNRLVRDAQLTYSAIVDNYQLNAKRREHGYATYIDPNAVIHSHPVLVPSVFGYEHARSMSPLVRMVGMYVDNAPYMKRPQTGHDKVVLAWLNAALENKASVIFILIDPQSTPEKQHLFSLIDGVLLSHCKVLLSVRHQSLSALNLQYNDLILGRDDNVTVVPFVPTQMVLANKVVKAFICDGNAQSVFEAVYSQVPLIMLPFSDEHNVDTALVVEAKIGIRLEPRNLSSHDVDIAVRSVLLDKTGRRMRKKMSWLKEVNVLAGIFILCVMSCV